MGKSFDEPPKVLNHDKAKKLLEAHGWTATIGGKHSTKMEKDGERPITLPRHRGADYGPGLRSSILKEAKLSGSDRPSAPSSESQGES